MISETTSKRVNPLINSISKPNNQKMLNYLNANVERQLTYVTDNTRSTS